MGCPQGTRKGIVLSQWKLNDQIISCCTVRSHFQTSVTILWLLMPPAYWCAKSFEWPWDCVSGPIWAGPWFCRQFSPIELRTRGNRDPPSATKAATLPEKSQGFAPEAVFKPEFTRSKSFTLDHYLIHKTPLGFLCHTQEIHKYDTFKVSLLHTGSTQVRHL